MPSDVLHVLVLFLGGGDTVLLISTAYNSPFPHRLKVIRYRTLIGSYTLRVRRDHRLILNIL